MSNLEYSKWHRQLGYSFFAMDVDYIEIREGHPVAVIEASLCTNSYPECEGINGVFNRFLKETGGFQLDMAYWVAKWLNIPAFVICLNDLNGQEVNNVSILCLSTGEEKVLTIEQYKDFIKRLPDYSHYFPGTELELPELLEILVQKYPGLESYPYFKYEENRSKWYKSYEHRNNEIENGVIRETLQKVPEHRNFPVKGETTHTRREVYERLRAKIDKEYMNLEWVEWRKNYPGEPIGRPAALLKTEHIVTDNDKSFSDLAEEAFDNFLKTNEYNIWNVLSKKMFIDWFFVAYTLDNGEIAANSKFKVWKNGDSNTVGETGINGYTKFLKKR